MKNYDCVLESEKKFALACIKSESFEEANISFCELVYGISRLEDFRIVEIKESVNEGYFPSVPKIIRVREK